MRIKSIIIDSGISRRLWPETVAAVAGAIVHITNRVLTSVNQEMNSLRIILMRVFNQSNSIPISYLKAYKSAVTLHTPH